MTSSKLASSRPESTPEAGAWEDWHSEDVPIRLGVSSCLLGEPVRFDGQHKRDRYLNDTLAEWVEWVSVCPEVEVGMGVPRPTIRLVRDGDGDRLVDPASDKDYTADMARYAKKRVKELRLLGLDGYVLKRGSPSCGMERIKVYGGQAPVHKQGVGHFARQLLELCPHLPVEEEGRLNDPLLRENFVERVFCQNRWRVLNQKRLSRRRLVAFHTAHKMLLRSHDEAGYRALGRLVADFGNRPDREIFEEYERGFATTLTKRATVRKHVNVMQHLVGYLKKMLEPAHKRNLLAAIEDYRQGLLPLSVPLTLLRYEVHSRDVEYARGQLYLEPHPKELMLRNHV